MANQSGDWEARLLTPGTYQLTFEQTGFKKLVRDGVAVSTSEMATVDVQLQVGDIGQSIEVLADAEMVSSASATMVRTLERKELEQLPTSSRNFTQLLVIEPGVSADISELLSNDNASISPSVNGARTTNNSFVFNGVDVTNLLCCNRPGERRQRHHRPGRRLAFAQRGPGARDARRGQAANQPLRRCHGAQRRGELPACFEERHQRFPRIALRLRAERQVDCQRVLL